MKELFAKEAKERQGTRTDIKEKFPESEIGQARDKAGEAVGVSGRYIDQAEEMVDSISPLKFKIYAPR